MRASELSRIARHPRELDRLRRRGCATRTQDRYDLPPDQSSEHSNIRVRVVFLPRPSCRRADADGIGTVYSQHGANERHVLTDRASLGDSAHASHTRAAHEPHQHSFQLIIGMVRRGHRDAAMCMRKPCEFGVAVLPRDRLCISTRALRCDPCFDKGNACAIRESTRRVSVGERFGWRPHVVDNVRDDQVLRRRSERQDQRTGIRPPRTGDQRAPALVAHARPSRERSPSPHDLADTSVANQSFFHSAIERHDR